VQGFNLGSRVEDQLQQNLQRAKEDMAKDPVNLHHSLAMHEVPRDGFQDTGGKIAFAFANRRQAKQASSGHKERAVVQSRV
jgi:hypothetical protein